MRNYLAFDLGAESGRVICGRLSGGKLELEEIHRFSNRPVNLPDGLRWDVLNLWQEIKQGLYLAVKKHNLTPDGMGLDTWGVDFALLDRYGGLIDNPYHYRDRRTRGMPEAAVKRLSREAIFEQTGIQFLEINTLFQLLALVIREAPQLEIAQTFLTIPDLFNYWLTGRKVCEFSNVTTTQCYDPRRRDWAWPLLQAMGLPTSIFPEIIPSGTALGNLSAAVAEDIGIEPLPVIAPACHDTGSAVAAVPAEEPDFVWISSGTWSVMGVELPEPVINSLSLQHNFTNEGGVGDTFRFSKNIMGLWLVQECRRAWAAEGETYSYTELVKMAGEAEPLQSIIDPDDAAFFRPGDMPQRIMEYCRHTEQKAPQSKAEILRCALESVALKYRYVLEKLEENLGRHLGPIHIVGGGSQNELLSQFTADAAGRDVLAGPVEATAMGNLAMQAVALGHLSSLAEARGVVRASSEVKLIKPAPRADWDKAYSRLLSLLAA